MASMAAAWMASTIPHAPARIVRAELAAFREAHGCPKRS
jgi:hypothetical protein